MSHGNAGQHSLHDSCDGRDAYLPKFSPNLQGVLSTSEDDFTCQHKNSTQEFDTCCHGQHSPEISVLTIQHLLNTLYDQTRPLPKMAVPNTAFKTQYNLTD